MNPKPELINGEGRLLPEETQLSALLCLRSSSQFSAKRSFHVLTQPRNYFSLLLNGKQMHYISPFLSLTLLIIHKLNFN